MAKLNNALEKTITTSGNTGSETYPNYGKNMTLEHLFVTPTNSTTTYTVTITDSNNYSTNVAEDFLGNLRITDKHNLPYAISGSFTITITTDNDEAFGVEIYVSEDI